jgi:hypothetical protein
MLLPEIACPENSRIFRSVRGMRLMCEICRDTENISTRKHINRTRAIFLHLVEYVPEDYDIYTFLFMKELVLKITR